MAVPENQRGNSAHQPDEFARLIEAARGGSTQALGELAESCRPYLLFIANQELESDFAAKAGASDLVQDTMISAQRCIADFGGTNRDELLAWLRGILVNDLHRVRRHYRTQRREVNREVGLGSESVSRGVPPIPSQRETPSSAAVAREERDMLTRAMSRLSEADRAIVQQRNYERLSFVEIGERTGREADAVRKQWSRAIVRLQKELDSGNG